MQTIKVILSESGKLATLKKDFPLYVGAYQNKLLNVLVPKSILAPVFVSHYIGTDGKIKTADGAYTAIKIGMTYLERTGVIKESTTYFMRYLKDVSYNNVDYALYERKLPKEFTLFEGQGENAPRLITNVVNVLISTNEDEKKSTVIEVVTSQYVALDVMYSKDLDNEPEIDPTDLELITAEINEILKVLPNKSDSSLSVLKCSVKETLPIDVTYNKDGFKTKGVLFFDTEFEMKTTINGETETKTGSILVVDLKQVDTTFEQTELFFYDGGIAVRKIILDSSLNAKTIGDWQTKVNSNQELKDAGKFLYVDNDGHVGLTSAIKDFIVNQNGKEISDKVSEFDFSNDFDLDSPSVENVMISLSQKIKERISTLESDNTTTKNDIKDIKLTLDTKTGMAISLSIDPQTFIMNLNLLDSKGKVISTGSVDLPLETMVVGASYSDGVLTLTLQNGQTLEINISDIVSGLVPNTRKINNKSLENDIVLTPEDIGAYSKLQTDNLLRGKADTSSLAKVATTNNYNDLDNLPIIPDGVKLYSSTGLNTDGAMTQKAVTDALNNKVTAEAGKGLSSNDFTDTYKDKIDGIESEANKTTVVQATGNSTSSVMSQNATTTELAKKFNSGYGTCSTAATTSAKVVTIADTNWKLKVGTIIGVKFTNSNTALNVTLNVNNTGAKSIWFNTSKYTGTSTVVCGNANRINYYMYDGTYWVWLTAGTNLDTNTVPSAITTTAAGTAAKVAACSNYVLLAKSYIQVIVGVTNTAASALTLNINGSGAKTIYINGKVSSATNYTLPAGSYIVYYDGTNYYFNTDGTIYGQQKYYDWVYVNNRLTTSSGSVTMDLSSVLPSTSNDEVYELLISGWLKNTSGSVGSLSKVSIKSDIYTNNATLIEALSQIKSVSYQFTGHMTILAHRYLYSSGETLDNMVIDLLAYRRVK